MHAREMILVVIGGILVFVGAAGATPKELPKTEFLGGLAAEERHEADGNNLFLSVGGKRCLRLVTAKDADGVDKAVICVTSVEGTNVLGCAFDDKGCLSLVTEHQEEQPEFLCLLHGKEPGKWAPLLYMDTHSENDPNIQTYIDIDFDGQFDVRGHYKHKLEDYWSVERPWIFAEGQWREVASWMGRERARVRDGQRTQEYVFEPNEGWVPKERARNNLQDEAYAEKVAVWKAWINIVVNGWKKGGADGETLLKWQDFEIKRCTLKTIGKSVVMIFKNGHPAAVFFKSDEWSLVDEHGVQLDLVDGDTAQTVVSAYIDPNGLKETKVWAEGHNGCLRITRSGIRGLEWDAQYYAVVPGTENIKGEMYFDLGFDGQFDVKAIYNGNSASEHKQHLVYFGNKWQPASSLNIAEGWAIISRGDKEVRLRFIPNKGWCAPRGN
jgi:hypothetical protein